MTSAGLSFAARGCDLESFGHVGPPTAVRGIGIGAGATGLAVGVDRRRVPVLVGLFRDRPTSVTVVGGIWLVSLLLFRMLALRVEIAVQTSRSHRWQGFAHGVTSNGGRITIGGPVRRAFPHRPLLTVLDVGPAPGQVTPSSPWQCHLTYLPRLTEGGAAALSGAELAILQRLTRAEVELAVRAIALPDDTVERLPALDDDVIVLAGGGTDRLVWLSPTTVERQLFGPARRD